MEEDPRGEQDCDLCQEQDILCNNGTPCSNCKRAHRVCTYAAGEVVATHETANRQQFEEHDPVHRRKRQMSGDQYTANNYPNMLAPSAGDESRMFCSEEPHRFNGLVMKGGDLSVGPLLAHSEPIHPCANRSAHRDSEMPHGYGVCTGCRVLAARHIVTTCPELVKYSWLPFCKICGEEKATASQDSHSGTVTPCSCDMKWLCYDCRERELEVRLFKIDDEEQKRQGILGDGDEPEGDVLENGSQTVKMGLSCSCGGSLADGGIVMQCAGCDELRKLPWTWSDVVELFSTQRAHAFKWA